MAEGLRLVVYDATGHGGHWYQSLLTTSWRVGVGLYRHYPRVLRADATWAATSWIDAFAWLASVEPQRPIAEIQYWGHGHPGRVLIAKDALDVGALRGPLQVDIAAVAARLSSTSLVWLRTCGAFGGERGQAFAQALSSTFRCRVAGHTHVIGPLQSGLHSLAPGQTPSWSTSEGLDDGRMLPSTPWAPHTITCFDGAIPAGW